MSRVLFGAATSHELPPRYLLEDRVNPNSKSLFTTFVRHFPFSAPPQWRLVDAKVIALTRHTETALRHRDL